MNPINSDDCIAGRWYESDKYKRVLCCGTTGCDKLMSFAVRLEDGSTQMRYFQNEILRHCEQCWEGESMDVWIKAMIAHYKQMSSDPHVLYHPHSKSDQDEIAKAMSKLGGNAFGSRRNSGPGKDESPFQTMFQVYVDPTLPAGTWMLVTENRDRTKEFAFCKTEWKNPDKLSDQL